MKIKNMLSVLLAVVVAVGAMTFTAAADVKDASKDVSLTICVNEAADESEITLDSAVTGEKADYKGQPVSGVSFLLYKTAPDETSVVPPESAAAIATGATAADGTVKIVLPAEAQGRYLVVMDESKKPETVTGATVPFLVDLPMTDPEGTGFLYDVYVYPKTIVNHPEPEPESDTDSEPGPVIIGETDTDDTDTEEPEPTHYDTPNPKVSKKVSDDNGKTWQDSVKIAAANGQRAYWKVSAEVPDSIVMMDIYKVGDVLDNRLIPPKKDEVKAYVGTNEVPADSYEVKIDGQTITVSFNTEYLWDYIDGTVDVIFPTAIDLTARNSVGVNIENIATLTFTKIGGATYDDDSDTDTDSDHKGDGTSTDSDDNETSILTTTIVTSTVDVWTGEICGFKHNKNGDALEGAEFALYRDKDCKQEITRAVSGKDGKFWFRGILDGKYYIKETKAPNGYQVNENILEAEIDTNLKKPLEIDVLNIPKPNLPETGGAGIIGVTLIGLSISVLGGFVIILAIKLRRKELCISA
ncbi:MAG: isopeptide-forming domain-containing fimbrial protein [Clostridia bacterium]|nr:isopeptide-forming domain-containing fimbrial protein [Clostridia bacterium]